MGRQVRGNTIVTVTFGTPRTPCREMIPSEAILTSVMNDCWREDSIEFKMGELRQDKTLLSLRVAGFIWEL